MFTPPSLPVDLNDAYQWLSSVPGADWRHPLGPHSCLAGLGDHPVVHLSWADAAAYAEWAGKTMPTEAAATGPQPGYRKPSTPRRATSASAA